METLGRIGLSTAACATVAPAYYHLLFGLNLEQSAIASVLAAVAGGIVMTIPLPSQKADMKAASPKARRVATADEIASGAIAQAQRIRAAAEAGGESGWAALATEIAEAAKDGADRIRESDRADGAARRVAQRLLPATTDLLERLAAREEPTSAAPEAATELLTKAGRHLGRFAFGRATMPEEDLIAAITAALRQDGEAEADGHGA